MMVVCQVSRLRSLETEQGWGHTRQAGFAWAALKANERRPTSNFFHHLLAKG